MAQNGTIFDEIGNALHLQSKLLQIIQTKMVTRLENQKQDRMFALLQLPT
jgi:transcriptional regulator with PAS, ATPase and Fis domain